MSIFIAPLEHTAGDLLIRAYRPGDGPALRRTVTSSYEHLRRWMPWPRAAQSEAEAEANCRRLAGNYLLGETYTLGIWRGDELVGGTGFVLRWGGMTSGSVETGMWISATHARQGLGTRILAEILAWGFTAWPWRRIVWQCDARNLPSAHVAEKSGLRLEGTFRSHSLDMNGNRRDTLLYAILREEWEARQHLSRQEPRA